MIPAQYLSNPCPENVARGRHLHCCALQWGTVSWFYLKSEHLFWTDTEGLCLIHSGLDQALLRQG